MRIIVCGRGTVFPDQKYIFIISPFHNREIARIYKFEASININTDPYYYYYFFF